MAEQNTVETLWQNYAFLTNEIVKFLGRKDFDLVLELLSQRDKLQILIEAVNDRNFVSTAKGRAILETVQKQNQTLDTTLKYLRNNIQRQQSVSHAYEYTTASSSGSYMDRWS